MITWLPECRTPTQKRKLVKTLQKGCQYLAKTKQLEMYPNEIKDAFTCVNKVLFEDMDSILFALLTQVGKTKTATAFFYLLKQVVKDLKAYYICANNEKGLRNQISDAIDLFPDIQLLTLQDRKKMMDEKLNIKNPLLVIFDENHYGDGVKQSIHLFLSYLKYFKSENSLIKNPKSNICFIGLSATGFSSLSFFDHVHKRPLKVLHKDGYNSCTMMLSKNKILDCDDFFDDDDNINWKCNVLKEVNVGVKKYQGCFGIIRCRKDSARLLADALKKKYGKKIDIKYWDQKNPLDYQKFFTRQRLAFTVVFIKNMARMGSSIPTEYIKFMASKYSVYSSIATVIQGEIGRGTGYKKQNHDIKIFSSRIHATAYSLFEQDENNLFALTCKEENIKPSARSIVKAQENPLNFEREFTYIKAKWPMTEETVKRQAKELKALLKSKYGNSTVVRTRSINKLARTSTKGIWDRSNKTDNLYIEKNIGAISIAILDFYPDEKVKKNAKIMVKMVKRVNNLQCEATVKPIDSSIYVNY